MRNTEPIRKKKTIGQPGRQFRGDGALAGHSGQADVSEVVDEECKQDREDIAARLAAFAGGDSERDTGEAEGEACDGKGPAAVKLDARFDAFGRFAGDLPNRAMKLRRVHAAEGFAEVLLRRIGLENLIPGGKRDVRAGDDVLTDFVDAGTDETQLDAVMRDVGNGEGLAGDGDARAFDFHLGAVLALLGRTDIGEEHIAPDGEVLVGRADIAYIQDCVGELLVEDAGLNIRRELRGDQAIHHFDVGAKGDGGEP